MLNDITTLFKDLVAAVPWQGAVGVLLLLALVYVFMSDSGGRS